MSGCRDARMPGCQDVGLSTTRGVRDPDTLGSLRKRHLEMVDFFEKDGCLKPGLKVGLVKGLGQNVFYFSRISLTFFDRCFMLNGFWMKPLQPRSRMSVACPSILYPLERSALISGLISLSLS